jgi:peptidoglycan hydrolase-like protein with peptidoglycan-binding domain
VTRKEYTGQPFGRPNPLLLTKSWRLQKNLLGHATRDAAAMGATTTLLGQDAVTVQLLTGGLPVYAGYCYGTYANMGALLNRFGNSAKLVSITPVVQSQVPANCLDIEPGDAVPGDAPRFQAQHNHGGIAKPVYYTSAGDLRAVINALSRAGYSRSEYFLWSAHWIGKHICSLSGCGYPQADATQYGSNNEFDSDIFYAYVFGAVEPAEPVLKEGATGSAVALLRERLDFYGAALPANADGGTDKFGPLVFAAVEEFQVANALGKDGVVGPLTWGKLLSATAKRTKPLPPPLKPATLSITPYLRLDVGREIAGYTGEYTTTITDAKNAVVGHDASTKASLQFDLPVDGTYTVKTEATGYAPVSHVWKSQAS